MTVKGSVPTTTPAGLSSTELQPASASSPCSAPLLRRSSESEPLSGPSDRGQRALDFLRGYGSSRINSQIMDERRTLTPAVVLDCARAGLLGVQVEQRYGGLALPHADTFRIFAQLGALDPNLFLLIGVHNTVGMEPICRFADQATRADVLPVLASGRGLAGVAVSEPGAGSNPRAMRTVARRQPDGSYLLNGGKTWTSLGSWAHSLNVVARLEDERGRLVGPTAFLVRGRPAGFTPGREAVTFGMRGLPQNEIDIRDVRLPAHALLGAEGAGMTVAQSGFTKGRVIIAAGALGAMQRCLQLTHRYAASRRIASGRLVENGCAREILTRNVLATRSIEIFLGHVARATDDEGEFDPVLGLVLKVIGSELLWTVVDSSVQMLGARGFLDTNVVGQFFRDYRLLRIFEGPTETLNSYLGTMALRNPTAFLNSLDSHYDATDATTDFAAALMNLTGKARSGRAQRHVLADAVGELACWLVVAELVGAWARRSSNPLDQYSAEWCRGRLQDLLRQTNRRLQVGAPSLTADDLGDQIAGYAGLIGDIEQTLPGMATRLDPLLRRQH